MAQVAYIDHSYHAKTLSTLFLVEILRKHGHSVDFFWDETWRGGDGISFDSILDYDVIIMFQACCKPDNQYYRLKHDNVIAIPMLDSFHIHQGPTRNSLHTWERFHGCKVISFSSALHGMATSLGISSLHVRYFPQPALISGGAQGLQGFCWLRHEEQVSWPLLRKLIGKTKFDSFHLHISPDPNTPALVLPTQEELIEYNIQTSSWFENKEDFFQVLEKANVLFAPRSVEGIGQSFLEAMARGQCVVAQDNGTMNEYILHGLNGLLYDKDSPQPLDFSRVPELGANARKTIKYGHSYWQAQEKKLMQYILSPAKEVYGVNTYKHVRMSQKFDNNSYDGQTNESDLPIPSLYHQLREYLLQKKLIKKTRFLWYIPFRLLKKFVVK